MVVRLAGAVVPEDADRAEEVGREFLRGGRRRRLVLHGARSGAGADGAPAGALLAQVLEVIRLAGGDLSVLAASPQFNGMVGLGSFLTALAAYRLDKRTDHPRPAEPAPVRDAQIRSAFSFMVDELVAQGWAEDEAVDRAMRTLEFCRSAGPEAVPLIRALMDRRFPRWPRSK